MRAPKKNDAGRASIYRHDDLKPLCLESPRDASWFRGVTVSTQDSESCDPSSNLGGTFSRRTDYF